VAAGYLRGVSEPAAGLRLPAATSNLQRCSQ
jgi:hypothetical protein